ncbi:hypothetical protein LY78DRAFT_50819 [Colletotrichum sublineola]|nr:hypothetical protein LY78DRAFT_50819 [Colletotrichum sublineola]
MSLMIPCLGFAEAFWWTTIQIAETPTAPLRFLAAAVPPLQPGKKRAAASIRFEWALAISLNQLTNDESCLVRRTRTDGVNKTRSKREYPRAPTFPRPIRKVKNVSYQALKSLYQSKSTINIIRIGGGGIWKPIFLS